MLFEFDGLLFYFLLFFAGLLASIISIFAGMAGGVILFAVFSFFLPIQELIPLHGAILIFSNLSRTFLMRKYVISSIVTPYALGTVCGAVLCVFFLITYIPEKAALVMIGTLLLWMLFPERFLPLRHLQIKSFGFFNLGTVVGALGLVIGSVGSLVSPFLLFKSRDKNEIVATKSALQIFTHLVKIPAFLYLGFSFTEYWKVLLVGCFSVGVGNELGIRLLKYMDAKLFIFLFKFFIFLASCRFFYQAFFV